MDFKLILEGIAVLGAMGAIFGALLAFAAKIFYVEVDPKQEAVRAGVPHKSGVLKVGVVHCRTLRRGLGEVVAALSALSHMGRLVLRAVWDVLPLF